MIEVAAGCVVLAWASYVYYKLTIIDEGITDLKREFRNHLPEKPIDLPRK